MTTIADDLADITLIKQGKLTLRKRLVELGEVLELAIDLVDVALFDRPRQLQVTKMSEAVPLLADRERLQQIIVKLLLNAAMRTDAKGHISVDVQVEGEHVAITVADDGIGIEPADLPYVFDIDIRAPRTEVPDAGIGLSLPLVRALVHLHGGTISARSQGHGTGSSFIVRLPIVR